MMRRLLVVTAIIVLLPVFGARPAHAAAEVFTSFDVQFQEQDDESLLDHFLTRAPRDWRHEWEYSPSAIRTSQGCLTSGQWFIDTDLKLVTALGDRAEFGFNVRQNQTDKFAYDWVDFSFRFPTAIGKFGVLFRPLFDKSAQDLGLTWEMGSDSATNQMQVQFILEDTFNNFWAFRQDRLGDTSVPYVKRPYEPTLRYVHRGGAGAPLERVEVGGTWLSHSVKEQVKFGAQSMYEQGLWGAHAYGQVEWNALGLGWELRGRNSQANETGRPDTMTTFDQTDYRRQWQIEGAMRKNLSPRFRAEARLLYQDRTQDMRVGTAVGSFSAIDRMVALDTFWDFTESWTLRLGGMHDNISVDQTGSLRAFSWGSRHENRAFVGLSARFGRVSVHAVEGFELDSEAYDVWMVHDKGFLHLQASF